MCSKWCTFEIRLILEQYENIPKFVLHDCVQNLVNLLVTQSEFGLNLGCFLILIFYGYDSKGNSASQLTSNLIAKLG